MTCVSAKFGTGKFNISLFDNDCSITPTNGRLFNRRTNLASKKLDLVSSKNGLFSKKIY